MTLAKLQYKYLYNITYNKFNQVLTINTIIQNKQHLQQVSMIETN